MSVLVIAGPTHTPLDAAREISNRSTGRTGLLVAEALHRSGLTPRLWLGENITHPIPPYLPTDARFHTVHDLKKLIDHTPLDGFQAILLPAALSDYDFLGATGPDQRPLSQQKWPGSLSRIDIQLRPAPRILPLLRTLAPKAKLVGWKWEASTSLKEAEQSARRQSEENKTEATVLNGPSYGPGYLFFPKDAPGIPCSDAEELGRVLAFFLTT